MKESLTAQLAPFPGHEGAILMTLGPYVRLARVLKSLDRKVGGSQYRHGVACLHILLEYEYKDSILLKAAPVHDLLEDYPDADPEWITQIDSDGEAVLKLVLEVTKRDGEPKTDYLCRLQEHGSRRAKTLKAADRISNLTDLHLGFFSPTKILQTLTDTEQYVLPMAADVDLNLAAELQRLVDSRKALLSAWATTAVQITRNFRGRPEAGER